MHRSYFTSISYGRLYLNGNFLRDYEVELLPRRDYPIPPDFDVFIFKKEIVEEHEDALNILMNSSSPELRHRILSLLSCKEVDPNKRKLRELVAKRDCLNSWIPKKSSVIRKHVPVENPSDEELLESLMYKIDFIQLHPNALEVQKVKLYSTFRVLFIGEVYSGKTCIIKRYMDDIFKKRYNRTYGWTVEHAAFVWSDENSISLHCLEHGGATAVNRFEYAFYEMVSGAFVVYDMTKENAFDGLLKWKRDLDLKAKPANGRDFPVILLANKCDLKEVDADHNEKMDKFCKEHGFYTWLEVSAKKNIGITQAIEFMAVTMLMKGTGKTSQM